MVKCPACGTEFEAQAEGVLKSAEVAPEAPVAEAPVEVVPEAPVAEVVAPEVFEPKVGEVAGSVENQGETLAAQPVAPVVE